MNDIVTLVLIFKDCLLTETATFEAAFSTSLQFCHERGFVGSAIMPPGHQVQSLAHYKRILDPAQVA